MAILAALILITKKMVMDHPFCRGEATRTPDPHVPNVVRYQLRYSSYPISGRQILLLVIYSATGGLALADILRYRHMLRVRSIRVQILPCAESTG